MTKILNNTECGDLIKQWRALSMGKRWGAIGFTCGTFDLLHAGHVDYLQKAREHCGLLVVACNTDTSVEGYKGARPILPQVERMFVLAGLSSVNVVTPLESLRPIHLLMEWRPDVYIKGGDYAEGELRSAGFVEGYGGSVVVIPRTFDRRTSGIKAEIWKQCPRS